MGRVTDGLYTRIWALGVRTRNRAKSAALLGSIEPTLLKLAPLLIPAPKGEVLATVGASMTMRIPPGYPAARTFAAGLYEPEMTRLFQAVVRPGTTIVDAGANVGYYTLLASSLCRPGGKVYAFEPDALNCSYLTDNVRANACSNVKVVRSALSNSTGTGRFVPDDYGAEGFLTGEAGHQLAMDVPVTTLDGFLETEGWPPVDVVKLDIEGSEERALQGMKGLMTRNPHIRLLMELNEPALSRSGASFESLAALLFDLGFVRGRRIEGNTRPFTVPDEFPTTKGSYNLILERDDGSAL